jgi:Zn-dependent protease
LAIDNRQLTIPAVLPLAALAWSSPLFWAIMIGWILSVTLHEFAHGLVAYLGGDHTIRERGLLTLNPLKYAHPVMTFILPVLFMAMGGIPMVGAATYVNVNLLRTKAWRTATSLAGPAVNLILFIACLVPLYPAVGWLNLDAPQQDWTAPQLFCGAMAVLQFFACGINLLPIPPLDGFNAISPYLSPTFAAKLREPQISMGILILLYFVLSTSEAGQVMVNTLIAALNLIHVDADHQYFILHAYNTALFGAGQ